LLLEVSIFVVDGFSAISAFGVLALPLEAGFSLSFSFSFSFSPFLSFFSKSLKLSVGGI